MVSAFEDGKLIGGLIVYPVTEKIYTAVRDSGKFIDDEITPDDVLFLSKDKVNHLFILDLILDMNCRGGHISDCLFNGLWNIVKEKTEEGYVFSKIYGIAVSGAGVNVSIRNHGVPVKQVEDGKYTLMEFDPAKFIDSTP